MGRSKYIYVNFDKFLHFTQCTPWFSFILGNFICIFPVNEWLCHRDIIISAFLSICLCTIHLCLNWYVFVFYKIYSLVVLHLENFVIYLSFTWFILHCVVIKYVFLLIYLWIVYICLLIYVYVIYIIYSLVVIRIGKMVTYIYRIWFIMPLSPSLLTWIYNGWLKYIYLNLPFSCCMNRNIYLFLITQYFIHLIIL